MPDYEYHIFISYRRSDADWVRWTRNNFVRPLQTLLRPALGNVGVFVDDQLENGQNWPDGLGIALSKSRLLIPILSRDYFHSDWCKLEITLMIEREKTLGWRQAGDQRRLILPVVIDDGTSFPPEIQAMQSIQLHSFANPYLGLETPNQQELTDKIRTWCPTIERALQDVPPFDPAFLNMATAHMQNQFSTSTARHTTLPRLSLPTLP